MKQNSLRPEHMHVFVNSAEKHVKHVTRKWHLMHPFISHIRITLSCWSYVDHARLLILGRVLRGSVELPLAGVHFFPMRTNTGLFMCLNFVRARRSGADFSTLKMEAIRYSETSFNPRSTQRHITEDEMLQF
jgi:hypothetical protein